MKKGKLLFLLLAILSLIVLFAACDEETPADDGTDASTEGTAEEIIADVFAEQDNADHEMNKYFDLSDDEAESVFTVIERIDGELTDWDDDHNLAVVKTQDLDAMENVITTYTVYDVMTGEVLRTESVTNPYSSADNDVEREDVIELKVTIEYPLIKVAKVGYRDWNGDADPYEYDISYYMAKKDGALVHQTTDDEFEIQELGNGLVCATLGDKAFWIDKSLNIVRSVDAILANGYDTENICSEYTGYVYSWDDEELLVFNRQGAVSGRYLAGEHGYLNAAVLNDGNVIVQEFTEVDIYTACDFVLNGTRYTMDSYIMNAVTGELTEVALDYIAERVETAYWQSNDNGSLKLAAGMENLAYIYRVAGGAVSVSAEICVIDNSGSILYSVKNDTFGVELGEGIYPLPGGNLYMAMVKSDGIDEYYAIFDLDGNFITDTNADGMTTDKYIITDNAIYDHRMNKVYDHRENGYTLRALADELIYLNKNNFVTGAVETYIIKPSSKTPELFCDGITTEFVSAGEGYYVIKDIEKDVYKLYNTEGTELLVSHEEIRTFTYLRDAVICVSSFGAEPVTYILK